MSYKKPTKNQKTDKQAKLIECVLPFCFWNYGEIYRPLADNFAGRYVSRRISGGFQLQEIIHTQEPRRAGHTTKKTELDDLREALCQRGKPRKMRSEWRITTQLLQFAVRKAEKWTKIVLRRTPVPDSAFHFTWLIPVCPHKQPQEARAEVFWERGWSSCLPWWRWYHRSGWWLGRAEGFKNPKIIFLLL